jgi:hypothetical protein
MSYLYVLNCTHPVIIMCATHTLFFYNVTLTDLPKRLVAPSCSSSLLLSSSSSLGKIFTNTSAGLQYV